MRARRRSGSLSVEPRLQALHQLRIHLQLIAEGPKAFTDALRDHREQPGGQCRLLFEQALQGLAR